MTAKRCTKCEEVRPLEDFHRKGKGRRARCKSCISEDFKRRYAEDPRRKKQIVEAVHRRRQKLRDHLRAVKESTPCADCHRSYPYYVMDFDHLEDKTVNISEMVVQKGWGIPRMQQELQKCEVVCSNCHRIRTHLRNEVE